MGRDIPYEQTLQLKIVSTHAPAWGATPSQATAATNDRFQPTRPHGARPTTAYTHGLMICFNPRARMGRDQTADTSNTGLSKVSTHAPAWGATNLKELVNRLQLVSTHAPAWGATCLLVYKPLAVVVSTHAPAWGATHCQNCSTWAGGVSTHAPAWGATTLLHWQDVLFKFQPTRPHGARRHILSRKMGVYSSFNPRARMGRDGIGVVVGTVVVVSTHAPAWGATMGAVALNGS